MYKVKGFIGLEELPRRGMERSETLFVLIRNQHARGSTPRAGSNEIKGLAVWANPIYVPG
jgi:hypothetical protein